MSIDKKAFRSLSYGMYIITAQDGDTAAGCVVNTFAQVTSAPFQVSVALNKENATASVVRAAGRFACTVLAESATMELIGAFGFRTSTDFDKFAGFDLAHDESGVPYVRDHAVARFSARVVNCLDLGTHLLFIGEVEEAEPLSSEPPMTYAYYHKVKGGKTPPKASSFIGDEAAPGASVAACAGAAAPEAAASAAEPAKNPEEGKPEGKRYGWQCKLCGYIVELDELPDDYECPICGAGKEMFERVEL